MPFKGQEKKGGGGGSLKGSPPQIMGGGAMPREVQNMPHASSMNIVKGSPDAIKSVSSDDFTTSNPRNKADVKSGQGPI
jgi:hypothetical protein